MDLNVTAQRDDGTSSSPSFAEQAVSPVYESENVVGTSTAGPLIASTSRARSNSSNSALHSKEARPTVSSSYGGDSHRRQIQVMERTGGGASDSDSEH
ncbi:hypothetical protein RvY_06852 [Ramazzottius varieornatus]|uniref:Uncharacterized protein n=1 Tax=Ramazzottius varieornatus TaxID=947166 RepID=A0A1D1V5A5_RAMVA|nr:hypothetical protein RvY_06852 [Ramazzottius varieornatus]